MTLSAAMLPRCVARMRDALQKDTVTVHGFTRSLNDLYRDLLDFRSPTAINKGSYINFNGLMARLMGQRLMNERVKLDNGHLTDLYQSHDTARAREQLTRLSARLASDGKGFLFVLAPTQLCKYESTLPAGFETHANENADALLAGLREDGVPVLDLRETMHAEGLRHEDAFFATDHHWKPETGFWAYTKIVEELRRKGITPAVDSLYTSLENYRIGVYEQWFLGSSGKRTGRFFAGLDDFSVITPKFETNLTVQIAAWDKTLEGTFASTALNGTEIKKDYFLSNGHAIYAHDNPYRARYENRQAPVDRKMLWLGDSFGNTVVPFLSLVFAELEDLDLRYCPWDFDFAALYERYQPDVAVVLVHAPTCASQANTTFDFFPDGSAL